MLFKDYPTGNKRKISRSFMQLCMMRGAKKLILFEKRSSMCHVDSFYPSVTRWSWLGTSSRANYWLQYNIRFFSKTDLQCTQTNLLYSRHPNFALPKVINYYVTQLRTYCDFSKSAKAWLYGVGWGLQVEPIIDYTEL